MHQGNGGQQDQHHQRAESTDAPLQEGKDTSAEQACTLAAFSALINVLHKGEALAIVKGCSKKLLEAAHEDHKTNGAEGPKPQQFFSAKGMDPGKV